MTIQFKNGTELDARELNDFFADHTGRRMDDDFLHLRLKNHPSVICLIDHKISGLVLSYPFAPDILEIKNIFISSNFRKLGTGSLLLQEFEKKIDRSRYNAIIAYNSVLHENKDDKKSPENFYLKNGYRVIGGADDTKIFFKSLIEPS